MQGIDLRRVFFGVILVLRTVAADGQRSNMEILADVEWNNGIITFTDGRTIEGSVRYNPKVGVLSFKDKANGESTSYTANTVSDFEFFDRKLNRRRVYYSLLLDDQGTGIKKPNVFEVLLELETFAVLSRMDPLELKQIAGPGTTSPDGIPHPAVSSEVAEQDETIFFADDRGNFLPYMRIIKRSDRRKAKAEVINEFLISKYTQPYYDQLRKFSHERDLSFDKKEDLLQILEYYKTLRNQDQ